MVSVTIPKNSFRDSSPDVSKAMNTIRSVWMGWGTLMAAGAAAYYYAKKDIDAHRRDQERKGLRETEFRECKSLPVFYPLMSVWSIDLCEDRGLLLCLSLLMSVGWQRIEGQENPAAADNVPKKEEKAPDEKPKKRRHNDKLG